MNKKYTSEILIPIVESSLSYAQVINKLGLKQAGGTNSHIKKVINQLNIDTSHFLGQGHNKGKKSILRLSSYNICTIMEKGSHRQKTKLLKRSMLELGLEYKCNICGIKDIWNGNPITLEVDHIDGNWLDNRIGNLRFLCPNCHSQQPTNKPYKFS